ncbi:MAG: response regulator transcription factor [Acinetobacter venetianus]|uniref:LuxR C-terminal-related transcriptional regulator n=1 Tax=Acinetobacter venetianus TaxID=52133 RepID=UPI003C7956DF
MVEQLQERQDLFDKNILSTILPKPVLIVEEDQELQSRLTNLLIKLNYKNGDLIISNTLQDALSIVKENSVAFALVNLNLPDGNGTKLIQTLKQQNSNTLILVISEWDTKEAVLTAIHAGATGYLLKERNDVEVSMSIKQILQGGIPIDPFLVRIILSARLRQPIKLEHSPENLSTRELEILEFVTQGFNNQDIANELGLSRYTIEAHLRNIYSKLSVDSRSKAIKIAYSLGLF